MSGPFVVDASIAGTWCFLDEASLATDQLLAELSLTYAEVPSLFCFEIQSMLRVGERKGRITQNEVDAFWQNLLSLDIRIEPLFALTPQPFILDLAKTCGLTAYDAAYLDLAQRKALPLATLDKALRAAAIASDVALLP